jgi:hypothetical protein
MVGLSLQKKSAAAASATSSAEILVGSSEISIRDSNGYVYVRVVATGIRYPILGDSISAYSPASLST